MKKKDLTQEFFVNKWLTDYFNTTIEEVMEEHPEWNESIGGDCRDFYKSYAVTTEQHDEWYDWSIGIIKKVFRCGIKRAERDFAFTYLDVAPSIKNL